MKKLNVGIVGYGWAAEAHIAAINATSNGQVTAICSARPLDPTELSAKHRCRLAVYHRLDDLLADPAVDIVDVSSYHDLHARQTIATARAGKHLIIEKPLALNPEDCRGILAAVNQAGVKTCVCFELRWSAQFQATRSLLESGLLGDLHYGEVDYYHGIGPWYREFEWCATRAGCGSSLLDNRLHSNTLHGDDRHRWKELPYQPADSGEVSDHPYQTQFDAFLEALANGETMPLTGLKEAVLTHEVIFAADRSQQLGRPVKLAEIRAD